MKDARAAISKDVRDDAGTQKLMQDLDAYFQDVIKAGEREPPAVHYARVARFEAQLRVLEAQDAPTRAVEKSLTDARALHIIGH